MAIDKHPAGNPVIGRVKIHVAGQAVKLRGWKMVRNIDK
jgi:hypothetical protein